MRLIALSLLAALPVAATASDLRDLTPAERAAFGAEVRALLLDEPLIVARALNPPNPVVTAMQDAVDADLALLRASASEVLGQAQIALFVGPDCAECAAALAELEAVSKASGTTFTLHNMNDAGVADFASQLQIDSVPFYILPDMVLRGHVPPIMLEKYLNRQ